MILRRLDAFMASYTFSLGAQRTRCAHLVPDSRLCASSCYLNFGVGVAMLERCRPFLPSTFLGSGRSGCSESKFCLWFYPQGCALCQVWLKLWSPCPPPELKSGLRLPAPLCESHLLCITLAWYALFLIGFCFLRFHGCPFGVVVSLSCLCLLGSLEDLGRCLF